MAALAVLAVVTLLKIGAYPFARRVLSPLPYAGLGMSGTLGLLLAGVPLWFLASLPVLSYTRLTAWLAVAAVVVLGALLARRSGVEMTRQHVRLLLLTEAVFLLTFLVALFVVAHAPDVWSGEKPLDMALIQSSLEAHHFPPRDPFLSGQSLDYYYYLGHFLISMIIRLAGVDPVAGYNACVALVWALAASAAFGLGVMAAGPRASTRRTLLGAGAVSALAVVGGNVSAVRHLFDIRGPLATYPWFQPARVIPDGTPNDFPVFQAILGELHAHVIAFPILLLCAAFALQVLSAGPRINLGLVAIALSVGSLIAVNVWSVPPAFAMLAIAAVASGRSLRRSALWFAVLIACVAVIFSPYLLNLSPSASGGVGVVHARSGLVAFLRDLAYIYGFALFVIVAVLVQRIPRSWWPAIGAAGAAALITGLVSDLGSVVVVTTAIVITVMLMRRERDLTLRLGLLVTAVGLGCILLPEVVYLKDGLSGTTPSRANTVFKFGASAFVLLGVGGGVLLSCTVRRRKAWTPVLVALTLGMLVYPLAGSYARTQGFRESPHLDGLRWLRSLAPGDPGAIVWLRTHAPRQATVVEAVGPNEFSAAGHGRFVVYTGRSAVVQWPRFLRFFGRTDGVAQRVRDVAEIYRTPSSSVARRLLGRYGVEFVIVGPLERQTYKGLHEAKFESLAQRVYEKDGTTVYKMVGR